MGAETYVRERRRLLGAAAWNGWASRLGSNAPDARASAARKRRENLTQLAALRRARRAGRSPALAA